VTVEKNCARGVHQHAREGASSNIRIVVRFAAEEHSGSKQEREVTGDHASRVSGGQYYRKSAFGFVHARGVERAPLDYASVADLDSCCNLTPKLSCEPDRITT
jgi:hypothetical protein